MVKFNSTEIYRENKSSFKHGRLAREQLARPQQTTKKFIRPLDLEIFGEYDQLERKIWTERAGKDCKKEKKKIRRKWEGGIFLGLFSQTGRVFNQAVGIFVSTLPVVPYSIPNL